MRKTKDGAGWVHEGYRIENRAHRHSVGGHAHWAVLRHGALR